MKHWLQEQVVAFFSFLPDYLIVVAVSATPVLELRGGIPLAAILGFSPLDAFVLGILGNLLPVLPILIWFEPISKLILHWTWYRKFHTWLYQRTLKHRVRIEKYGAMALILFTAVPLPTTGAYSACLAAIIFMIPKRHAIWAISTGVIIAAIIVTFVSYSIF